jgi:hypothetical protein
VDVGERLSRQPGRLHPGRNKDESLLRHCSFVSFARVTNHPNDAIDVKKQGVLAGRRAYIPRIGLVT